MLKQFYQPWKIKPKSATSAKCPLKIALAAPNADISAVWILENPFARSVSLKSNLIINE
jgi:hypothetical protein